MFVTGRQDGVAGYEQAWSIIEDFPRGTFAVLDRAGHWVVAEQPALLHALANEWLDRVEEYAADNFDRPLNRRRYWRRGAVGSA